MAGIDTLNDCEAWVRGKWQRVSVVDALAYVDPAIRCYKCHGRVVLMRESHDGRQAHAEHRPKHKGCPLTHRFIPGTPFSLHPNPVEDPLEIPSKQPLKIRPETKTRAPLNAADIPNESDESACPEGAVKFKMHQVLERDPKSIEAWKARRLSETGKLECEVCQIDFFIRYGIHGYGYIQAHHKTLISQMDGTTKTKIGDIAFVCSNCHRMLHRGIPLLTVEQLRGRVSPNKE